MTQLHAAIRQARESEREQVEALIALAGGRSVPGGDVYVATLEERVAGTVRLTRLADDEWWLDGLCVQPEYQGQGIGRALHHHAVQRADAQGSGTLRFAAASRHRIMHRLAAQTQFSQVGSTALYLTDALAGHPPEFRLAEEIRPVQAFLTGSPHFAHAQRSIEEGAIWCRLNDTRLQNCIAQARVYTWHGQRHDPNSPDGVIIFGADSAPPLLTLAYLDATVGALADLCRAVRRLAGERGYRVIRHRFLARPERLVAVEQAGWRPPDTGGESRDLFSRPLGMIQERLIDL